MKFCNLRSAMRLASLPVGIATALAAPGAWAQQAQPQTASPLSSDPPTTTVPAAAPDSNTDQKAAANLDRIEVTGSRIRRVDAENASPVVVIDHAAIERSGKLTLGDLVQELPNLAGQPMTPTTNNGGGTGASTLDLRGFGSQRTLVLIDGRRAVNAGINNGTTSSGADVNMIPASAVERIEVLTVGASSVYGSDAVAGVVNFIMRKDFQGLQATIDVGASSRGDGQRQGGSYTFGQYGEKGNVMAGVDYNHFNKISSADRDFSKDATYLYSGTVTVLGSSRNPRGRINLPSGSALRAKFGCSSVTRIPGASGIAQSDYRCYDGAVDSYNYQRTNLIETPQERASAFFLGNYRITDDVTAFMQVYHNKTSSAFGIAAIPFDATSDAVTVSKDNYYNPFGVTFGPQPDGTNTNLRTRFTSLGQRQAFNGTTSDQVVAGLEGVLGQTWKWDFALNYGHINQSTFTTGYVYYAGLRQALGPSFRDPGTGVITCGTPTAPISGCTPLNIFNIQDPQTIATLKQYSFSPLNTVTYVQKGFEANASGELFNLPAGAVQLAFGGQYRREYQRSEVDFLQQANDQGTCAVSQEICGANLTGSFSVGELYGELFVPLLKDVPFAKALNLTFGSRYSNYSNFGNTVNNKLALEWRPFSDLLLRGTVAEVFRAPSIGDLFTGPSGNAPNAIDPCIGYTNSPAHSSACGAPSGATNIPAGGIESSGLSQTTGVISGSKFAGVDLKPEEGRSYDWGLVYDPSWLTGFSVSLDYWRIALNNTITSLGAQTVLNGCYQDNANALCSFIHRTPDGQIQYVSQPVVNLGRLDSKGWDLALRYKLPQTGWGNFNFGFDGTYIAQWDNDTDPTSNLDAVVHVAGHYNKDYGNYARVRARAFAEWKLGDWSVGFRTRYVGPFSVGNADTRQGTSADAGCSLDPVSGAPNAFCGSELHFPSYVVHSLNIGYALPGTNSHVEVGVDNLTDKQPPFLYQNNVINANTDPTTFDTIGRYYFARYTVKF